MTGEGPGGVVLVVDDDPRALRLMQLVLEHEGYRVLLAADADAARERMAAETPDVLATDLMLPGTSGVELCRWVREQAWRGRTPRLLLVTAMDTEESRRTAAEAGIDELVTKPVELADLRRRIARLMQATDRP